MSSLYLKVSAVTAAVLLASPIFAKKFEQDILTAPAPITISSISNVFIDAAITPQLKPKDLVAPAAYAGDAILTITMQNNSPFDVTVSCTGNIAPSVCSGNDLMSCNYSWLSTAAQSIAPFTNDSSYNSGSTQSITKLTAGSSVTISRTYAFDTSSLSTPVENIFDIKLGSEASGAMGPLSCTVTPYTTGKYYATNIDPIVFPVMVPLA